MTVILLPKAGQVMKISEDLILININSILVNVNVVVAVS